MWYTMNECEWINHGVIEKNHTPSVTVAIDTRTEVINRFVSLFGWLIGLDFNSIFEAKKEKT